MPRKLFSDFVPGHFRFVTPLLFSTLLSISGSTLGAGSGYHLGVEAYRNQQLAQARGYWRQGAEQGDARSAFNLALLLAKGLGGPEDQQQAARLFRRAADSGLAAAQYNLGLAYYAGRGVERDFQQARLWWELAASQGHQQAQFNLGALFWNGEGIEKNATEALKWFREAADNGNQQARDFLAKLHDEDRPTDQQPGTSAETIPLGPDSATNEILQQAENAFRRQDYASAYAQWQQAAENGNAYAQLKLAGLYREGLGVPKDPDLAYRYTQSSAQQNLPEAQYQLGLYYLEGYQVEKNPTLALYWLQSAADQGHSQAKKYLESIR